MTLTPEQIALRRTGITATDIAKICGVHPFRGPIDVWMDKMGHDEPSERSEASEFGALWAEPFLRSWYSAQHGDAPISLPGTVQHPEYATHMATPDGIVLRPEGRHGLEAKAHGIRSIGEYGEPGTDHVPRYELMQCAWGMHVCAHMIDLPLWDLVRYDVPHQIYRIHRDMELEEMLAEEADRFWVDYVVARKPPPPDGTARYSEWLARRYPRSSGAVMHADTHLAGLAQRLRFARSEASRWTTESERIAQEIQALMGDAEVLDLGDERVTWRTSAGKTKWKEVAEAMASSLGATALLEALAKDHKSSPSRRFNVPRPWGKET